jgi:hypothetical protein
MSRAHEERGQASVELIALLPVLALLSLLLWQAVVAGQALWVAGSAAREAARARALGDDPERAARTVLPPSLRRGMAVVREDDGVTVRLPVPAVVVGGRLGTVAVHSRLEPQA